MISCQLFWFINGFWRLNAGVWIRIYNLVFRIQKQGIKVLGWINYIWVRIRWSFLPSLIIIHIIIYLNGLFSCFSLKIVRFYVQKSLRIHFFLNTCIIHQLILKLLKLMFFMLLSRWGFGDIYQVRRWLATVSLRHIDLL